MNTYKTAPFSPRSRRAIALAVALSILLLICACAKDKPAAADESAPATAATDAAEGPDIAASQPPVQEAADPIPPENAAYDLNIMSLCPYGITALAELTDLLRAFPQSEFSLWFIGRVEGDKLASLRGEPEMLDETLWLGVKALYPARYRDFLTRRANAATDLPTETLLKQMGFDYGKIRKWADVEGRAELREHYSRSVRLAINASPTLYLNYRRYEGRVSGGQLVRIQCQSAAVAPPFCQEYPECASDADCVTPGKLGKCANLDPKAKARAVCEYSDDAAFALTVLTADPKTGVAPTETQLIESITATLPGAQVNIVFISSDEGKRLSALYTPSELPLLHFEKPVEGALRFQRISGTLEPAEGGYTLKKGTVRANYFPLREEKPGLVELYADPLNQNIKSIINALLSNENAAKRIVLRPAALPKAARAQSPTAVERVRDEEALRWIVLAQSFPKSYNNYLKQYAEAPASSYWFEWLKPAGINPKAFMRKLEAARAQKVVEEYGEGIAEVYQGEPAVIMVDNRAKITPQGEQGLLEALAGFGR